ncbi:two-component regulator propeller domain-containing protein [Chryseolinea soli]|uniref:histidine kinase n=1 Tax=Chryseolinea soli TaxID=2321403 RepID=A0A385ST30_9BACT|nr:two-component regulator propeller domain-containing protein [Chryseolinea soli]AYB31958.1 hybrid sensor histidine kinase/response regulator [Chryseolinea soli]
MRRILIAMCAWSVVVLSTLYCHGQTISRLDVQAGLSNSTVTSITKDKYGFIWIGTFDGLNRYDGYSFTKFRTRFEDTLSLPDNQVNALTGDSTGKIWIGTRRGAAVMEPRSSTFSRIRFYDASGHELSNRPYVNILRYHHNHVFIGTSFGVFQCPIGSTRATYIDLGTTQPVNVLDIGEGHNGTLYLTTVASGVVILDWKHRQAKFLFKDIPTSNCIAEQADGTFWIGTNAGIYEFNLKAGTLLPLKISNSDINSNRIMHIVHDSNGLNWISSDGGGLYVVNPKNKNVDKVYRQDEFHSISSNHLYCVYIDEEQRKWIGTMRGGVSIIEGKKRLFNVIRHEPNNPNSLASNVVFSLCQDGDNVWIGTDENGLSVWNRITDKFENFQPSKMGYPRAADHVPSIAKDKFGDIFVATYGAGVFKFDKKRKTFIPIKFKGRTQEQFVWSLFLGPDSTLWAGCIHGSAAEREQNEMLFKYNRECDCFVDAGFPITDQIVSIGDDHRGNLWVGTFDAAIRLSKNSPQIQRIDVDASVRDFSFEENGTVWMGTQGTGLLMYNATNGSIKTFTEREGLPNNTVQRFEKDRHGYIWVSTLSGLSRFKPRNSPSFQNYSEADGLQGDQFYFNASATLSDGTLLFGGLNGLTVVSPDTIGQQMTFPNLYVTGMRVLNSNVGLDNNFVENTENGYDFDKIVLPYSKAMFSLDIVAPEYSYAGKIKYSYFLNGWDKDWNYLRDSKIINYSSLQDGTYVLQIRTTNANGEWSKSPKIITVVVLPPWYRTWWAYIAYALIIAASLYGYSYYQRKKAEMEHELELSKLKAEQEVELNERKISFFTNIAHELRTPLTLIVNPIKDLLNNEGKNINVVDISAVHRNASRLLSLVDQLLLFKSTENDVAQFHLQVIDMNDVCNEVYLCFTNQVKAKRIQYNFQSSASRITAYTDREKVEIVLFNLVSNAIKYTPPEGMVSITLTEHADLIEIQVRDSGPGIPVATGQKLFDKFYRADDPSGPKKNGFGIGLHVSKRIAMMQQGSLTYKNSPDRGTMFTYQFPKGNPPDDAVTVTDDAPNLIEELAFELADITPIVSETAPSGEQVENLIGGKATVLAIDDDPELRSYIRKILQDYRIIEAGSANEGLEIMKKTSPDIIISDIVMPGMNGVDFCSIIKESPDYSHIPVILLTGTSSPEVKLKGIECGADDYITKPFEKELLLARIKNILKGRSSLRKYFFNEITLQQNAEKVSEEYRLFLRKCIQTVEDNLVNEDFTVAMFAKVMNMSHSNLYRKVKSMSGLSVNEFIRYLKLKRAAELLITTDSRIKEVAYTIGFENVQYFREQFTKLFTITPSEYVKRFRKKLNQSSL